MYACLVSSIQSSPGLPVGVTHIAMANMVNRRPDTRVETDQLGEVQIPLNAYWGARTARVREHLSISGQKVHPRLLEAFVTIKKAAAFSNLEAGRLSQTVARTIAQVCDEVLSGQWRDQFVVDALAAGAGGSLNDNANEVIANRGSQILGGALGKYDLIDPVKDVNKGQSTSDVYPTAMRIAILSALKETEPTLADCERLLRRKSLEFERVLKPGRVHLQDSVPITLGQEFNAYGSSIERAVRRVREASAGLLEINIGATHVGTGFDVDADYSNRMLEKLCQLLGMKFRAADDMFRATQSVADFLDFSSALRGLATDLIKIANDLRLMNSGPNAGFSEIFLPPFSLERSPLMPGHLPDRSFPALPECLLMVCCQISGNDHAIALAAQAGQFEANPMTPVICVNILDSLDLLKNIMPAFNQRCLSGITANTTKCSANAEASGAVLTALSSQIGVEKARRAIDDSKASGQDLKQVLSDKSLLSRETADRVLSYKFLTTPGFTHLEEIAGNTTDSTTGEESI